MPLLTRTSFVRTNSNYHQISDSFPNTVSTGLGHIISDCIRRGYIDTWIDVARELRKTSRDELYDYDHFNNEDLQKSKSYFFDSFIALPWQKKYDFCEVIYFKLAYYQEEQFSNFNNQPAHSLDEAQAYIEHEIQQLFLEEFLAYDFNKGYVIRKGRKHTVQSIEQARYVMGDNRLTDARFHFNKASNFFQNRKYPDYENTVKEAVCALKAAGKQLFQQSKAVTLGDLLVWLRKEKSLSIPQALIKTIEGIYGLRNSGEGVSHGGSKGGPITAEAAEYTLSVCASAIIYLVDVANSAESEITF